MLDYADASTSEPVNRQNDIVRGSVVSAQDSAVGVPPRRDGPTGADGARHPGGGAVAGGAGSAKILKLWPEGRAARRAGASLGTEGR